MEIYSQVMKGWNFFQWKICLIWRSFFTKSLWWQIILLRLSPTNGLGIAVVSAMCLLRLVDVVGSLCVIIVGRLLGVGLLELRLSLMMRLLGVGLLELRLSLMRLMRLLGVVVVLILLGLALGELSLEGKDALSFSFDFSGNFFVKFNLSVVIKIKKI